MRKSDILAISSYIFMFVGLSLLFVGSLIHNMIVVIIGPIFACAGALSMWLALLAQRKELSNLRVWLDDVRPKPAGFDIHVRTAEAAIELLKTGDVSYISLDNDLGEGYTEGREVAKFLERAAFEETLGKVEFDSHSSNPVAADEIAAAQRKAYQFWDENEKTSSNKRIP